MTMNKLLGISLAIIMVLGSVPLGFSEPLRVQLEQGLDNNQIQCNNPEHVLVLRTNGNVACVTESTAQKTGWEIVSTLSKINYNFPISSSDYTPIEFTKNGQSISGVSMGTTDRIDNLDSEIIIDGLPLVGETFNVEIKNTFKNDLPPYIMEAGSLWNSVHLTSNLEIINPENYDIRTYDNFEVGYDKSIFVSSPEISNDSEKTYSTNLTLKVLEEGIIGISATESIGIFDAKLIFVVSKSDTLLYDDFAEIYPQQLSVFEAERAVVDNSKLVCNIIDDVEVCSIATMSEGDDAFTDIGHWDELTDKELLVELMTVDGFTEEDALELIEDFRADQKKTTINSHPGSTGFRIISNSLIDIQEVSL